MRGDYKAHEAELDVVINIGVRKANFGSWAKSVGGKSLSCNAFFEKERLRRAPRCEA